MFIDAQTHGVISFKELTVAILSNSIGWWIRETTQVSVLIAVQFILLCEYLKAIFKYLTTPISNHSVIV